MKIENIELFETERLIARRIQESDFNNLYQLHNDPKVAKTLGGRRTKEEVKNAIANCINQWDKYGYCYWMFFSKDTSGSDLKNVETRFVGRGGLRHISIDGKDEVEIGYAVMSKFWNQGFATEIGRAAIQVASQLADLNNLVCFTLLTNKASQRVMQKLGFIYERDFVYANMPHALCRLTW